VDLRPQWNVDGQSVVFERKEAARSRLFLLRLEGERTRSCEALELCNREAHHVLGRAAFFAPDVFAYVSDRGGQTAIWHADLERRVIEPLTLPMQDEADFGPSTSPDANGVFVFFRILGKRGRPHLLRGELGSGIQPLTIASREGDQPWLLPGADRIVFHSRRDGDDAIFVRNLEPGSNARRVSADDERTAFVTPFPSPTGKYIVFASAKSGLSQLWMMRADGSGRQQLTFDAEPSCFPAWSPEGRRIVFVRGDPNASRPTRLMMMKIETA
jgi:TolB protein